MAGFIAKQPNGLYCRFSTVIDCPTHYNFTPEEYLSNITGTVRSREEGEDILNNHVRPFSDVLESYAPKNMCQQEFDNALIDMSEE